jgi:hypothetical protein
MAANILGAMPNSCDLGNDTSNPTSTLPLVPHKTIYLNWTFIKTSSMMTLQFYIIPGGSGYVMNKNYMREFLKALDLPHSLSGMVNGEC